MTDDASKFTESNLAKYRAVVFLNTAGELLDSTQRSTFEQYSAAAAAASPSTRRSRSSSTGRS